MPQDYLKARQRPTGRTRAVSRCQTDLKPASAWFDWADAVCLVVAMRQTAKSALAAEMARESALFPPYFVESRDFWRDVWALEM